MLTIANPIYDTFFKYLMQDEAAAKCLLSAVLDQEITVLECLPQEHVISSSERPELSVIRFDYRATIRQPDGTLKKVLVELQKVRRLVDIGRFRRYLGSNYAQPTRIDDKDVHLPIVTIYLLGFELDVCSPLIRVGGIYIDALTRKTVEGVDAFIEALTHQAYFIQIPRLPLKQQSRVERVLGLFSQRWVVDHESRRMLQIPDELYSDDNESLVKRLSLAVADADMQSQAIEEESFDKVLLKELSDEFEKGAAEGKAKGKLEVAAKMLKKGMSPADVMEMTGLSAADIAPFLTP